MSRSVVKRDAELQDQVIAELRWDTRVDAAAIGVAVQGGVVTLSGGVASYAEKLAAQEAAHRVAGVLDVANEVEVQIPGGRARTDEDIARAIRQTFDWSVFVPANDVRSTVSDGWVTFEGTVSSWHDRVDVESLIRNLLGVRGVSNKIVVNPRSSDTLRVQELIEEALERRAERQAKRIQVQVENGTATVSGIVPTWLEKQAVIGAVGHAPGIQAVKDHLTIDPYLTH